MIWEKWDREKLKKHKVFKQDMWENGGGDTITKIEI